MTTPYDPYADEDVPSAYDHLVDTHKFMKSLDDAVMPEVPYHTHDGHASHSHPYDAVDAMAEEDESDVPDVADFDADESLGELWTTSAPRNGKRRSERPDSIPKTPKLLCAT